MTVRDEANKISLILYLSAHPELRLWQAIRNWSRWGFIMATDRAPWEILSNTEYINSLKDTFYLEGPDAQNERGMTNS